MASCADVQRSNLAIDFDRARVGPDQPEQHVHQGRLAGAVFANDGMDLARADGDRYIVDGDQRPEANLDAGEGGVHQQYLDTWKREPAAPARFLPDVALTWRTSDPRA